MEYPAENTDRELWRERDDYYADRLFVTKDGRIGINCGGFVMVKPIREWFRLANLDANPVFIVNENGTIQLANPAYRKPEGE